MRTEEIEKVKNALLENLDKRFAATDMTDLSVAKYKEEATRAKTEITPHAKCVNQKRDWITSKDIFFYYQNILLIEEFYVADISHQGQKYSDELELISRSDDIENMASDEVDKDMIVDRIKELHKKTQVVYSLFREGEELMRQYKSQIKKA